MVVGWRNTAINLSFTWILNGQVLHGKLGVVLFNGGRLAKHCDQLVFHLDYQLALLTIDVYGSNTTLKDIVAIR